MTARGRPPSAPYPATDEGRRLFALILELWNRLADVEDLAVRIEHVHDRKIAELDARIRRLGG